MTQKRTDQIQKAHLPGADAERDEYGLFCILLKTKADGVFGTHRTTLFASVAPVSDFDWGFVMISPEVVAEIRRLYTVEGWRRQSIARHLGLHHGTVKRALDRAGLLAVKERKSRASILDPYMDFIRETFQRYPDVPMVELYEMARRRGYPGGPDYFRHRIQALGLRPRKAPEAFLRLRTLPGEQAQVDWAYFGEREVEGGRRRLWRL